MNIRRFEFIKITITNSTLVSKRFSGYLRHRASLEITLTVHFYNPYSNLELSSSRSVLPRNGLVVASSSTKYYKFYIVQNCQHSNYLFIFMLIFKILSKNLRTILAYYLYLMCDFCYKILFALICQM